MNNKPMHFRRKLNYLPLFGIALGPLIDIPVYAQGARMEEVIVTARRKEENLQEVPIAVTALTPEALKEKNVREAVDLMYNVPSLTIAGNTLSGGGTYNIRGQGGLSLNAAASVTNYFADVVVLGQNGNGKPVFDVQSVQVLKGPQGTLFGRNSIGGAVVTTPVAPGSELGGFIQVQKGERNLTDVQGAIDLPVSDIMQFRVAGLTTRQNGYTRSRFNGEDLDDRDHQAWRISWAFQPFEGLENTLIYDGFHSQTNGSAPSLIAVTPGGRASTFPTEPSTAAALRQAIGGMAAFGYITPQQAAAANAALNQPAYPGLPALLAQARSDVRTVNPGFDIYAYTRNMGFYNTTSYEINDDLTIKNIASYQKVESGSNTDLDGTPYPIVDLETYVIRPDGSKRIGRIFDRHQITEELQLQGSSFDDQLEWIVGGFFLEVTPDSFQGVTSTSFAFPPALAALGFDTNPVSEWNKQTERSKAVFGQATYQFGGAFDKLSLTAGYRYTWDYRKTEFTKISTNRATVSVPAPFNINTAGLAPGQGYCSLATSPTATLPQSTPLSDCVRTVDLKSSAPSWTIGLDYQIDPDTLVYLAHRRGYRSGGFNFLVASVNEAEYDPETVDDIELGLKATFALTDTIQARTNLAVYKAWWEDVQTTQQKQTTTVPPRSYTVTQNAGKAHIDGAEAEIGVNFDGIADLSLFYSYTDGDYTDDVNKGRPFEFTPLYSAGATLTGYAPIPEAWGRLSASLTWYEKDEVAYTYNDPNTNPHGVAPRYHLLNARIDWRNIGGSALDLGVFATNLTDEEYIQSIGYAGESSFGVATAYYAPPRTLGAELRYHFGGQR